MFVDFLSLRLPVPLLLLRLPQNTVYVLLDCMIQLVFLLRKLLILRMQRFEVGQLPAVPCRLQHLSGGFVNDNAALIATQELFFVLCLFVLRINRL